MLNDEVRKVSSEVVVCVHCLITAHLITWATTLRRPFAHSGNSALSVCGHTNYAFIIIIREVVAAIVVASR